MMITCMKHNVCWHLSIVIGSFWGSFNDLILVLSVCVVFNIYFYVEGFTITNGWKRVIVPVGAFFVPFRTNNMSRKHIISILALVHIKLIVINGKSKKLAS